jgi:hypothetical protein
VVYITRYDRPEAVVLSIEEFNALAGPDASSLDDSTREFDDRLAPMQSAEVGRALEQRLRFAFATTLGGTSITGLLIHAANVALPVRMWYVGLRDPDLHIQRVRARGSRWSRHSRADDSTTLQP